MSAAGRIGLRTRSVPDSSWTYSGILEDHAGQRGPAAYSKSDRGKPDCRIMLDRVPARTGA